MIDLKNISAAIDSIAEEKKKVQGQLEILLRRREELHTVPLPKEDFIEMFLEEQNLRENELSDRLYRKYSERIKQPMSPVKLRGKDDSPLSWPRGTTTIPNDIWHVIFEKQINAALVKALKEWPWPEEVGPTRAERRKELETLDKDIDQLKDWLTKATQVFPG